MYAAELAKKVLPVPVRAVLASYWKSLLTASATFKRSREISRKGTVERWDKLQDEELAFWDDVLSEGLNSRFPYVPQRYDPELPLQPHLCAFLDSKAASFEILDVGSGPLTTIGKRWGDKTIHITAIDPNAEHYDVLLAKHGVTPLCRAQFGYAEALPVASDVFDLVHAQNSLDHSRDPLKALDELVRVVKPGHYIFLHHSVREGWKQKYEGPHQWNFYPDHEHFCISRPGMSPVDITERLQSKTTVTVGPSFDSPDWFVVRIQRHPENLTQM